MQPQFPLRGKKTYIAAIAMAGLGLLQFATGDRIGALTYWSQALGLFGLRSAIQNGTINLPPSATGNPVVSGGRGGGESIVPPPV